jgi:hypothetical protein
VLSECRLAARDAALSAPADRDTPLASGLRLDAGADNKKPGPPTRFSVSDVRVAETVRKHPVAYLTMTFAPTLARL